MGNELQLYRSPTSDCSDTTAENSPQMQPSSANAQTHDVDSSELPQEVSTAVPMLLAAL